MVLTVPPSSPPQSFTRLGKCYTFNSGAAGYELLTTVKGGTGNGLELMLNIQQDEYLPVWGDTGERSGPSPSRDPRGPTDRRAPEFHPGPARKVCEGRSANGEGSSSIAR